MSDEAAQNLDAGTSEQQEPIIGGGGSDTPVAPAWPDDWRVQMAGGNDKDLKRLEGLGSPQDVWSKYRNMESEFSKRQPRLEYSSDMPEAKLSEWRKQEGIPESADKYDFTYDDGLVIGEADKPFVDEFAKFAHENNLRGSEVKQAVRWYMERQANEAQEYAQKNHDYQVNNLAELKQEWGAEYKGNINAIGELFVDHPEIKDLLFESTDGDGMRIGNNAQLVRWAVDIAKRLNPTATLVFPDGESGIKGAEARIAEIERMMGTPEYYKNPALGKEYDDLVSKLQKANPRR